MVYKFPNPTSEIGELIKRRRLQILVLSCMYYEMDETIISDEEYDRRSIELVELLKKYPNEYSDRFDKYFVDWDGSTGYNLPHRDPWVYASAERLLRNKGELA